MRKNGSPKAFNHVNIFKLLKLIFFINDKCAENNEMLLLIYFPRNLFSRIQPDVLELPSVVFLLLKKANLGQLVIKSTKMIKMILDKVYAMSPVGFKHAQQLKNW